MGRVTLDGAPRVGKVWERVVEKVKTGVSCDCGLRIWSGREERVSALAMVAGIYMCEVGGVEWYM
jgi:hypothetical protein